MQQFGVRLRQCGLGSRQRQLGCTTLGRGVRKGSAQASAKVRPNGERRPKGRSCGATTASPLVSKCVAEETTAVPDNPTRDLGSVVVVDNYDSFTYNLCQYLGELKCDHTVIYNDAKTVAELKKMRPSGILISPGPGRPEDSGISMDVIRELGPELPIMGVCMGLQCMAQVFGGVIIRSPFGVMHGRSSEVFHLGEGLLAGLPIPFTAARYHSLVVEKSTCPEDLEITAWTEDGTIMGIRHKELRHLQAVQFHPESILTDYGKQIIQNFINSLET